MSEKRSPKYIATHGKPALDKKRDAEKSGRDQIREQIGSLLSTALWIFLDISFVWPESHITAWWLGTAWILLQCIENPWLLPSWSRTAKAIGVTLVIAIVGDHFIPPTPRPESASHFWVETGRKPLDPRLCRGSVGSHDLVLELGDDLAVMTPQNYHTAVVFQCAQINLVRGPDGAATVSTILRDGKGRIAVRITENEIRIMPWEEDWSVRSDDRSNAMIFDSYGRPVLMLTSMNSQVVRFQGVFYCGQSKYVVGFPSGLGVNGHTLYNDFCTPRELMILGY